ncbi:hypothetical protein ACOMHN_007085 [Nucella lapillus]
MALYQGDDRRWVWRRRMAGVWTSRTALRCASNCSTVAGVWLWKTAATSARNCDLSMARRFLTVWNTGVEAGLAMSMYHITGMWSEVRLGPRDTDRRISSSSLKTH